MAKKRIRYYIRYNQFAVKRNVNVVVDDVKGYMYFHFYGKKLQVRIDSAENPSVKNPYHEVSKWLIPRKLVGGKKFYLCSTYHKIPTKKKESRITPAQRELLSELKKKEKKRKFYPEVEYWRNLEFYRNYQVSTQGRVRIAETDQEGELKTLIVPILTELNGNKVMIYTDSKKIKVSIRQLVIRTFLGIDPEKQSFFYRNGDKFDNATCNILQCTTQERDEEISKLEALEKRIEKSKVIRKRYSPEKVKEKRLQMLEQDLIKYKEEDEEKEKGLKDDKLEGSK